MCNNTMDKKGESHQAKDQKILQKLVAMKHEYSKVLGGMKEEWGWGEMETKIESQRED